MPGRIEHQSARLKDRPKERNSVDIWMLQTPFQRRVEIIRWSQSPGIEDFSGSSKLPLDWGMRIVKFVPQVRCEVPV